MCCYGYIGIVSCLLKAIFGQDYLATDAEDFENPVDDIVGWQSDGHVLSSFWLG